ncbi:MAG TPA: hypothetical protein VG778_10220, partial [Blastocatellia bacterium]|nr:hypothetical protein [Blastocatellia bacterium]
QERSADGASYYVREVATDGGRLNQQFCFAYAGGKLIVTTTEGLMLRALKNAGQAGADSMIPSVVAAAEGAEPGFTTHEATMWLDQVRLNKNRYFTSNWIHGNATAKDRSASGNIESGIIDLQLTREAMIERRWFKLAGDGEPRTLSAQQIIALSRFAPTDAKLIEFHARGDELKASIARTLFGELGTDAASAHWSPPGRDSNDDEEESDGRTTRYRTLDTRFDKDVDDDQPIASTTAVTPGAKLEQSLTTLLGAIAPVGYVEIARSKMEAGKPFVRFERALVIEMQNAGSLDRAALERLITDELRERFVVKGSEPRLEWQEEAGVRYAAQSLMEQAAAYAVSDKYLVLASNRELVRDALKPPAAGAAASRVQSERPLEFFARVRVEAERPVFDKLMSTLDGRVDSAASADPERTIKFFSDNLSSLIAASAVREVTVQRSGGKGSMFELVSYYW